MDERIRPLIELTRAFLAEDLDATSYDAGFRDEFSRLPPGVDDKAFDILEDLAIACDNYVEDPELRDMPEDLDEEGLRAAARRALTGLGLA